MNGRVIGDVSVSEIHAASTWASRWRTPPASIQDSARAAEIILTTDQIKELSS